MTGFDDKELRELDIYLKDIEDLREYGELEGCEWGEEALWLCNNAIDCESISDKLYAVMKDEVRRMLSYAQENFVIKERPVVHEYTERYLDEVLKY